MPTVRSALVVQDVLGAGVCVLIGLFAWRRWGLLAGLLAESLLGLDIPSIANGNLVLSDTLFALIITVAVLIQLIGLRGHDLDGWSVACLLSAGLLIGIAALVRPIGQVLIVEAAIPFFLCHRASTKKRIVSMCLALCLSSLVVVGWSYRNYEQRGVWTFSSVGAVNLYAFNAAGVLAYESGRGFDEVQEKLIQSAPQLGIAKLSGNVTRTFAADPAFVDLPHDTWTNAFDADPREMERRAARILLAHPLVATFATLKGFLRNCFSVQRLALSSFFFGGRFDSGQQQADVGIVRKILSTLSQPWLFFLLFAEFAVLVFTWIGAGMALVWICRGTFDSVGPILIPLGVAIVLLAAAAGPLQNKSDRFRVPAIPMLALVAAFGWSEYVSATPRNSLDDKLANDVDA